MKTVFVFNVVRKQTKLFHHVIMSDWKSHWFWRNWHISFLRESSCECKLGWFYRKNIQNFPAAFRTRTICFRWIQTITHTHKHTHTQNRSCIESILLIYFFFRPCCFSVNKKNYAGRYTHQLVETPPLTTTNLFLIKNNWTSFFQLLFAGLRKLLTEKMWLIVSWVKTTFKHHNNKNYKRKFLSFVKLMSNKINTIEVLSSNQKSLIYRLRAKEKTRGKISFSL